MAERKAKRSIMQKLLDMSTPSPKRDGKSDAAEARERKANRGAARRRVIDETVRRAGG